MKYYDPAFRLIVYTRLLSFFNDHTNYNFGFCHAMENVIKDMNISYDPEVCLEHTFLHHYPELYKHKPTPDRIWWFPNYERQIRIDVLNECIKDVKLLIKQQAYEATTCE